MVNIPPHMIERMKTMTPEKRREVIEYFRRNDEEEKRLAQRRNTKRPIDEIDPRTPVDQLKSQPSTKIPETIKRPSTSPNEFIKRPEKMTAEKYAKLKAF